MKPTTRYLLVVFATLAAFIGLAEAYLRTTVIDRDDRARRVRAVYESKHKDVMIGDSTLDVLFPIPGFENLAPPGATAIELELLTRAFFRFREPRRVLLLAAPQLFGSERIRARARGSEAHYGQHIGVPLVLYSFEPGTSRLLAFYGRSIPLWLSGRMPPRRGGYEGIMWADRTPANRAKHRRRRLPSQVPVRGFRHTAHYTAYQRLVEFLAERNATVCMFRNPSTKLFRKGQDASPRTRAAIAELRELAASHGFRFVDGIQVDPALDIRDFTTADHLGPAAAERFTRAALAACFPEPVS